LWEGLWLRELEELNGRGVEWTGEEEGLNDAVNAYPLLGGLDVEVAGAVIAWTRLMIFR
jgi:hypothetical protein